MEIYQELEEKYADFSGKSYGIAVNSGTSALHLALVCMGIGPGDEVIVPDFAFASVAFAVTYTGAKPVFVDCDYRYNISASQISQHITKRTKAVIVVHTYGRDADVYNIRKYTDLPIIEDLCEAQGIMPERGTIGVYSFYRNKILPAEEGGMIVTDDIGLRVEANLRKNMGNENFSYYHPVLGFNYRMTNSQAKLALESFDNRQQIFIERGRIHDKYIYELGGIPVETPWVFTRLHPKRDKFLTIPGTRCFFKPQSSFPIYDEIPKPFTKYISGCGYVVALDPKLDHDSIIKSIKEHEDKEGTPF